MPDLSVYVEHPNPGVAAVFAFLSENLGLQFVVRSAGEPEGGPHLRYGSGESTMDANAIVIPEEPNDLLWDDLLAGRMQPALTLGKLPFDLVGAIGRFLRDDVPHVRSPAAIDSHGRLRYAASAPAAAQLGDRPIVNEYVAFLEKLIWARFRIVGLPRWPNGYKAAIGLSHDVDLPDRYAILAQSKRPWRLRRSPRTYFRTTVRLAVERSRDPQPDDHWLFDPIMESERAFGFQSTFFFATVPFYDKTGAPEDVPYDVAGPRFRQAFRSIREAGFEIGLHASYRAHEDVGRLAAERARLSSLASTEIAGIRHHYWHLGPEPAATLRAHEAAGFGYDSSLAFNDHVGFRRSVALPFHPYDAELGRPLRTIQLPTFCMDGNLFYESEDIESAVATIDAMINAIVELGGMGSIDWHIQTSHPMNRTFRSWGLAYQRILSSLAGRPDVWVTSLGAIADWVAAGSTRVADVQ